MGLRSVFFTTCLLLMVWACVPYEEQEITDVRVDFGDTTVQKLYTFQHQRLGDSLYTFLSHRNPTYRYLSALAFASIRQEETLDSLAPLLNDPSDEVRAAAAYAIGQIGSEEGAGYLTSGFAQFDTSGQFRRANRAILEAVGKCGPEELLEYLSTIKSYKPRDTFLLEGQAWGIYRYALRGLTRPEGTARMIELVRDSDYPPSVRFISANYLFRARDIQIPDSVVGPLGRILVDERDPRIRMTLVIGLGKTEHPEAMETLLNWFPLEQDYRVKCNILLALGNFPYADCQATAWALDTIYPPLHTKQRFSRQNPDAAVARSTELAPDAARQQPRHLLDGCDAVVDSPRDRASAARRARR
ncbi:MAG: HEAT repeat domain-containing protein, partial [Saprospiraceae bacterium]|nr:HEAT repeat domain-containing protein [Saprospiraceae bacterium]